MVASTDTTPSPADGHVAPTSAFDEILSGRIQMDLIPDGVMFVDTVTGVRLRCTLTRALERDYLD